MTTRKRSFIAGDGIGTKEIVWFMESDSRFVGIEHDNRVRDGTKVTVVRAYHPTTGRILVVRCGGEYYLKYDQQDKGAPNLAFCSCQQAVIETIGKLTAPVVQTQGATYDDYQGAIPA